MRLQFHFIGGPCTVNPIWRVLYADALTWQKCWSAVMCFALAPYYHLPKHFYRIQEHQLMSVWESWSHGRWSTGSVDGIGDESGNTNRREIRECESMILQFWPWKCMWRINVVEQDQSIKARTTGERAHLYKPFKVENEKKNVSSNFYTAAMYVDPLMLISSSVN